MAAPMKLETRPCTEENVFTEIFADDDSESDRFSKNSDSDDFELEENGYGGENETDGNICDYLSDHGDDDVDANNVYCSQQGQGDDVHQSVGASVGVVNNAMLAAAAAPGVPRPGGPADPCRQKQGQGSRRNQHPVNDWTNIERFLPQMHQFTGAPGINLQPTDPGCRLQWLKMFLTNELVKIIVQETNKYAEQYFRDHSNLKQYSRCRRWKPLSPEDFWLFLALLFNTGIVKKPEIQMYWSTDRKVATPFYSQTMARDKFLLILKFLHFSDNNARHGNQDRLYKIRPVYDYIINKFKAIYTPEEKLSLDEGMLKWRDHVRFRVCNPEKPNKYGIKGFIVSELNSGYICNYGLDCGSGRTVQQICGGLLEHLYGFGYKVYLDNYYNSVALANFLLEEERKIHVCGKLQPNRGALHDLRLEDDPLQRGQVTFCRDGDALVLVWKDKDPLKMMPTLCDSRTEDSSPEDKTNQPIQKHARVLDGNKHISALDKLDRMAKYYPCLHKNLKWSKKFVLYLFEVCIVNSHILYNKANPQKKLALLDFRMELIDDILAEFAQAETATLDYHSDSDSEKEAPQVVVCPRAPRIDPVHRLVGGMKAHELVEIPPSNKKRYPSKPCRVCKKGGKRSETRYFCKKCQVPLHKGKCFKRYHVYTHY